MSESNDAKVRHTPVAIVGMGCLFPGARGVKEYWRLLRGGEDQIRNVPASHWSAGDYGCDVPTEADLTYCTRGAFLDPVVFDPTEFGIVPTALESTDTAQLLTLLAAKEALKDAGYDDDAEFDRSGVSVILGVTGALELVIPLGARLGHPIWRKALAEAGVEQPLADDVVRRIGDAYVSWQESSFPGLLGNVVAGRIANRLNLHGTNCVVDAACASSLSAVHLAMLELSAGRSNMVLTGGTDTFNDIFMFMCFAKTQALSKSGDARPFSASADGTVIGEGVGVVALKRLDDAIRDKDRVYAVIKGVGTSSDGKSQSIYAPLASGQARALRDAYEVAGVSPADIELVEGHGTGTKVGDATEYEALRDVYREAGDGSWCALGSVKSQIGHTKAAAGVAGLIKAALALHHKVLPPTIKIDAPNPAMDGGSDPFYVTSTIRPWLNSSDHPRTAAVSSFGFGGSNFHAVLSEHGDTDQVAWDSGITLIACSAADRERLLSDLREWKAFSAENPSRPAVAHRATTSRAGFCRNDAFRLVLVIGKNADLGQKVDEAISRIESGKASQPSKGVYIGGGSERGKLAFVLSGQASQYVNMARDLACAFPEARRAIEFVDRSVELDAPLRSLIYPIPSFDPDVQEKQQAELTQTDHAQPALGAVSLLMLRVLNYFGVAADMVAGHSYGELCALHAAGAIDEGALIRLSAARGRAMAQSGDQPGTMLAVSAPLDQIDALVAGESLDVVLANRNGPTQGVLSGSVDAIDQAEKLCDARGWSTRKIDVSAAFHSKLMTAAADDFERELNQTPLSICRTPVYATQNGATYPNDPDAMKSLLAGQMLAPVDFVGQIRAMYDAGARTFVEVGPKRVMSSLIARILKDDSHQALPLDVDRPSACGLMRLAHVLGALAADGFDVKLDRWDPDCPQPREPRMKVTLTGANYRADRPPVSTQKLSTSGRAEIDRSTVAIERSASCDQPAPPSTLPAETSKQLNIDEPKRKIVTAPSNRTHNQSPDPAPLASSDRPINPLPSNASSNSGDHAPAPSGQMSDVFETVQEGLRAMQSLQQQTAAAHQRFLEGQELAHQTFERVLNGQQRLMEHLLTSSASTPPVSQPPTPVLAPPPIADSPVNDLRPASSQSVREVEVNAEMPANGNASRIVIEALSATTGYPADAIHAEMDLAEDLNLDRVSRVRLLDELRQRNARFAEFDAEAIQRVGSVCELIDVSEGRQIAPVADANSKSDRASAALPVNDAPVEVAAEQVDVGGAEQTLIEVVAELTGYPAEMLDADMDLEADLGIDSIKRVEILATLQERIPQMSAVDSSYIGSLRTLRNIVEYIGGVDSGASTAESAPSAEASPFVPKAEAYNATNGSAAKAGSPLPERQVLQLVELPQIDAEQVVRIAANREVWIASPGSELANALRDHWTSQGVPSRVIDVSNPPDETDSLGGLVVLADDSTSSDAIDDVATRRWLRDVFALTSRAAPPLVSGGGLFATVSRMDGRFGLTGDVLSPLQGALAGLVKTAQHEWPDVNCKALDVSADWSNMSQIAKAIAAELAGDGPVEVGLDGSSRFGLAVVDAPLTPGELELDSSDVVLVTGGARGVTADSVVELARRTGATFRLWGRSPQPSEESSWLVGVNDPAQLKQAILNHAFEGKSPTPKQLNAELNCILAQREISATLDRIQSVGGRAVYSVVDVCDADAVRTAADQIKRESGPITALIHGAGVIDDRLIADKTIEQFDRVFGVKVDGLNHVLSAIELDKLRWLVLFSSVSARFGNRGQADYAMANEALNKIARTLAKRYPRCAVTSINWGPWDGGMVTPSLAKEFGRRGVGLIAPRAGAESLVLEMEQPPGSDVEVVIGDGLCPESAKCNPDTCDTSQPTTQGCVPKLTTMLKRSLSTTTHSFLRDHVIGGRPVLPAAMMLEWMAHGAMHDNPGLRLFRIDDFRVLRAAAIDGGELELCVAGAKAVRSGDHFASTIELRSGAAADALHARASFVLANNIQPTRVVDPSADDRVRGSVDPGDVYQNILFHGSRFQLISSLTAADENGIAATLRTQSSPSEWMDDPVRSDWILDPAIVDGVLQLGIVWCHYQLDALSLPSRIKSVELFAARYDSQVQATLAVQQSAANRLVADVVVINDARQMVMRLSGIEWTVDPALRGSFATAVAAGANS